MDQSTIDGLLRVFGLMVLERWPDGSFVAASTAPEWFPAVSRDGTFPFLGAFLEEATSFWAREDEGRVGSGLCAATDEAGNEFHFEAWAVTAGKRQFLVIERSGSVAQLQETLQKAREEKLAKAAADRTKRETAETLHELTREVRTALASIRNLLAASEDLPEGAGQRHVLEAVRVAATNLGARLDALVGK